MTTACPCFGRNENCRLCHGSGLITSEVESKVLRSQQVVKTYVGQTDAQKAKDAAATKTYYRPLTDAELKAAQKRRIEADNAMAEGAASERARKKRDAKRNAMNLRRRQLKAELEANLEVVLKAKQGGLLRDGPYRCNRCKWIHEIAVGPCELCGAEDGYTEAQ